jgi:hypothetical protein
MSIQTNFPAIKPTLLLDFANTKQLDPRITFTRASTATYYGTQTAKAEENLLLQSQTFDNASWISLGITTTADTSAAPDGTTTADSINELATTEAHRCAQNVTLIVGQTYTVSVFVKPLNGREFQISFGASDVSGNPRANFNLTSGILGDVGSGLTATITASTNGFYRCTTTFVAADSALSVSFCAITTDTAARQESYAGDVTKGIILWGAQLEQRSAATAYTPTTTQTITNYIPQLLTAASGVARFDHNPTTFESLGLEIEEQRTNLLTYSEQFDNAAWTKTSDATVTPNTNISPSGALVADSLIESTGSLSKRVLQTATTVASTTYTLSLYAKPISGSAQRYLMLSFSIAASSSSYAQVRFDLVTGQSVLTAASGTGLAITSSSITSAGNGWYRCVAVGTIGTNTDMSANIGITQSTTTISSNVRGSENYTGDGYSGIFIWGAQLEAGAFPTSYIQTVASQVTRAADSASMTGTNFSSWYNQAEGTLYAEANTPAFAASYVFADINDGTTANGIRQATASNGTNNQFIVTNASTTQASPGVIIALGANRKMAGAYATNNVQQSANGVLGTEDTSATIPTGLTQINIGNRVSGISALNGTIRKVAYYPLRVTNAQLQGLTS